MRAYFIGQDLRYSIRNLRRTPGLAAIGLAGIALGVAGALLVRRLLTPLLFGIAASDPTTPAGAAALLLLVIVIASAVPAKRAMRIDPMQALRSE